MNKDYEPVTITISASINYYWADCVATIVAAISAHEQVDPLPHSLAGDLIKEIQALIELAIDFVPDSHVAYLKRMLNSKLAQMEPLPTPPAAPPEPTP